MFSVGFLSFPHVGGPVFNPATFGFKQIKADQKPQKIMTKYIDTKQLVTIVAAAVVVFLLQKYLTKKFTKPSGEVVSMIGNDAIGHV